MFYGYSLRWPRELALLEGAWGGGEVMLRIASPRWFSYGREGVKGRCMNILYFKEVVSPTTGPVICIIMATLNSGVRQ